MLVASQFYDYNFPFQFNHYFLHWKNIQHFEVQTQVIQILGQTIIMVLNNVPKLLLRYLILVGVPFVIARKIENYFWKNIDSETKKKIGDELTKTDVDNSTGKALNNRGGTLDPVTLGLIKFIMVDFGLKVAISTGFSVTIWSEAADKGVEHLIRYSSAIIAAPGIKLAKIAKHFKGIDEINQNLDIREIVLDKRLSFEEKVELLKLKIDYALKNLKGKKRKQFILLLIATLTFFYGNNIVGFTWLWERIRCFIGRGEDTEAIKDLIITIYREYNAPLPEGILEQITDEL